MSDIYPIGKNGRLSRSLLKFSYFLGNAYRTLAEVKDKAENCQRAIKAYEEALRVFTKEEFPEIYSLVANNFKNLLDFCRGK